MLEKWARLKTRRLEKEASGMGKQIPAGGMFLMERDIPFKADFIPEDFSHEHRDVANVIEEYMIGDNDRFLDG